MRRRDLRHAMAWRDFVTHQISQHCAAYFDRVQAAGLRTADGGLYASWVRQAARDRGPPLLMGDAGLRARAPRSSAGRTDGADRTGGARRSRVPDDAAAAYFTALLLSINGWASWCAYQRWQARLAAATTSDRRTAGDPARPGSGCCSTAIRERSRPRGAGHGRRATRWPRDAQPLQQHDWLLQGALERAYQAPLCDGLRNAVAPPMRRRTPAVQAVFCIDVRSEVFRRALESAQPEVADAGLRRLLRPADRVHAARHRDGAAAAAGPARTRALRVTDVVRRAVAGRRRWPSSRRAGAALARSSGAFRTGAGSGFTFVESLGLLYFGKLLERSVSAAEPNRSRRSRPG